MKIPTMVPVSGEQFVWKCPACHQSFDLALYAGTHQEKTEQMETDYERHFKSTHAKEDAS